MGSLSIGHWLIVLLIVLLIFGTKKLKNIGSDLGEAVKGFKDGVKGANDAPGAPVPPSQQVTSNNTATGKSADPNTVDVEAKTKH